MKRAKAYLMQFPLPRLVSFAGPYKLWLVGLAVVAVVLTALSVAEPLIIKHAIDKGLVEENLGVVYRASGLYLLTNAVTWGLSYVQTLGTGWVGQRVILDIRNALFGHLQSLSLQFYSEQKAGWIISHLTNDIENLNTLLNDGVQNLVKNGLTLIGVIIAIFLLEWQLALAVVAVVPVMALGTAIHYMKGMKVLRRVRETTAEITAFVQEAVSGMRVVQTFGRQHLALEQLSRRNLANRRATTRTTMVHAIYFPGVEFLSTIGLVIVLLYGGHLVMNNEMTIGTLVAFVSLLNMAFQPIQQLSQLYSDLQSALASLEKIFTVLNTEPDTTDTLAAKELDTLNGEVQFSHVSFAYGDEEPILKDMSFHVRPGETVAIVGETGTGKSTIIKLLCRFFDPTGGTVWMDGKDLRDVRGSSLRSHIGVVFQDTFLFAGTIKENIRYGRLDATEEEIVTAAKTIGADDFIRRHQEGYETHVGEQGGALSVGERQLIAFTRALIAKPKLLILDEATSSVDSATESQIETALSRMFKERTAIIVAHRLYTVSQADRILVVADGRVVEQGSHTDLVSQPSVYRRLYEAQFEEAVAPPSESTFD